MRTKTKTTDCESITLWNSESDDVSWYSTPNQTCLDFNASIIQHPMCLLLDNISNATDSSSCDTNSDGTDTSSYDEERCMKTSAYFDQLAAKNKTGTFLGSTSKKNASRIREIKSSQIREIKFSRRKSYLARFIDKTNKEEKEKCQEESTLPIYSADQNGSRRSDDPISGSWISDMTEASSRSDMTDASSRDVTFDEICVSSRDEERSTNSTKNKMGKMHSSVSKKNASSIREIKSYLDRFIVKKNREEQVNCQDESKLDRSIDKTNKGEKENCQDESKLDRSIDMTNTEETENCQDESKLDRSIDMTNTEEIENSQDESKLNRFIDKTDTKETDNYQDESELNRCIDKTDNKEEIENDPDESKLDRFIDKTDTEGTKNCEEKSKLPIYSADQSVNRRSDDSTSGSCLGSAIKSKSRCRYSLSTRNKAADRATLINVDMNKGKYMYTKEDININRQQKCSSEDSSIDLCIEQNINSASHSKMKTKHVTVIPIMPNSRAHLARVITLAKRSLSMQQPLVLRKGLSNEIVRKSSKRSSLKPIDAGREHRFYQTPYTKASNDSSNENAENTITNNFVVSNKEDQSSRVSPNNNVKIKRAIRVCASKLKSGRLLCRMKTSNSDETGVIISIGKEGVLGRLDGHHMSPNPNASIQTEKLTKTKESCHSNKAEKSISRYKAMLTGCEKMDIVEIVMKPNNAETLEVEKEIGDKINVVDIVVGTNSVEPTEGEREISNAGGDKMKGVEIVVGTNDVETTEGEKEIGDDVHCYEFKRVRTNIRSSLNSFV